MRSAVIIFPGSNRDRDMIDALTMLTGHRPATVWYADDHIPDVDLIVLPGGFSYGDYLRAGAIAARAPVMAALARHAAAGVMVMGICNGFQILCEAGLLPGVLMLEALVQTAAWLVRVSTDFQKSLILLREARNVRYGSFVRPGERLEMDVSALEITETQSRFKAVGRCEGEVAVQAKLVLEHLNLFYKDSDLAEIYTALRPFWRQRFQLIGGPQALEAAGNA